MGPGKPETFQVFSNCFAIIYQSNVISSSIKRIRPGDENTTQLQTLGKPTSLQLGSPEEAERIYTISIV